MCIYTSLFINLESPGGAELKYKVCLTLATTPILPKRSSYFTSPFHSYGLFYLSFISPSDVPLRYPNLFYKSNNYTESQTNTKKQNKRVT